MTNLRRCRYCGRVDHKTEIWKHIEEDHGGDASWGAEDVYGDGNDV